MKRIYSLIFISLTLLITSINLANAKEWSNCRFENIYLHKPANWNSNQISFESFFPRSFSFTDDAIDFRTFIKKSNRITGDIDYKIIKFYSANYPNYAALLGSTIYGQTVRVLIKVNKTKNKHKFKMNFEGARPSSTGWMNFTCAEPLKSTSKVKSIVDKFNAKYKLNNKEFGLLGTWNGTLSCSNKVYNFSAFVEGKKAQIYTAGVNYKGDLRFNNDKTTAKFFGAGDDGKGVTEVISISDDFKVIKGKMSSGCMFNAKSQSVKVYGKNNKSQKTAPNKKMLCGNEVSDVVLNSTIFKAMQRNLKALGYYKSEIDGMFGKGSCKALREYLVKETKGSYKTFTLSKFNQLNDDAKRVTQLAKKDNSIKEDASVCDKATILQNGIRRWNLDNPKAIKQVKSRGLDCKITVGNTPFTQKEAKYFLLQLTDFVSKNPSKFDLSFSLEFNKVRRIANGEWNVSLSKEFEFFRIYVSKFVDFKKYLEDIRLAEKAAEKKRIEQLRASISQSMAILKEWAQKNVLDEKSAQIAALESQIGKKGNQSINSLEQLLDDAQRLLAATGINDSTDGDASELVSTACLKTDITQCSDNLICEKATIISDGIRRWNFEQPKLIQQVKSRGLDCKITIDTSPFTQKEAKYFLLQLTEFVSENPSKFDLSFSSEFNKVRRIANGEWNVSLSKEFEFFRTYVSKFIDFKKYLEDIRLAEKAAEKKRIEQLRASISQSMAILKEWAQKNVLDEKSAQIAALESQIGMKGNQSKNSLEQLLDDAQRLLAATGINDSTDGDASELVSTACLKTDITQCSDNLICEKATIISDGIRRWNFEQPKLIQQVKSRGLDCKITIDTSPFTQKEAKYFLSQLMAFVSENPSEFGLNFATEFNKVRDITSGKWNSNLSKSFELFRGYTSEFPLFQKYMEDIRLAELEAKQVRLEQLRETAVQDMIVLREWAQKNVLDEKAAQIASLDARFRDKNIQTINGLEQLIAETKRLFSATGIKDTVAQNQTNEIVNSLYNSSSIYLFANVSGDATKLYKNLDGEFSFEQSEGTYCASNKLDAFDYYVLQGKIFTTFNDLSKLTSSCSASADVFVVKGNEITSDTVFNVIKLDKLQQVLEVPKSERDTAFNQLNFLKDTIKKDVIAGDRIGYGLLKTDTKDSSICAVIGGSEQGHVDQLEQSASLLKALSYPWKGFNKITNNAEEAFKSLQRGKCSSVYGSALTLGRLYLAGETAGINMEFMPIWVSKSAVEAAQKSYDATLADSADANAKLEQSIKDKEKLDKQAQQSKAELASVRQSDLREKNGLRFMVLRDELQALVFSAVNFAFENPADEAGYIKKYLSQSFVDQSTRYSPFDGIISDIQKLAAERWEITEQRIEQVDYGKAKFNGRELDAIEVELRIASKNRLVGKYSEYCQRIHVIKDDDFEMWRNFEIGNCDVTSATRKWKDASSFESLWIVEAK